MYPLAVITKVGSKMNKEEKPKEEPKLVIPRRKKHGLVDFLMMSTDEVFETFKTLPGAKMIGEGRKRSLYVPATRKDSVLLVAHADTIPDWDNKQVEVALAGTERLVSAQKDVGIGADDRAGITMLWKLSNLGHAILIPDGEERHGLGSYFLMSQEEWRKEINKHNFAIQMDRMGNNDLAFYGVATGVFKDWCEKNFEGYKRCHGAWTDICVLCDDKLHKEDCLDGMNISVGYYGQHSSGEYIVLKEWHRTLSYLHTVLSKENIPSFHHKYEPPKVYENYSHNHSRDYGFSQASYHKPPEEDKNYEIASGTLVCPDPECEGIMEESEYRSNNNTCVYCHKPIDELELVA
jgi:hypothetical protein